MSDAEEVVYTEENKKRFVIQKSEFNELLGGVTNKKVKKDISESVSKDDK